MNIFVGNLSFASTEEDVKKLFEGFGAVTSVVLVTRKEKRIPKPRGFGFVEMPDERSAFEAVAALNGKEFMGRVLNVAPTRPDAKQHRSGHLRKPGPETIKAHNEGYARQEITQRRDGFRPSFKKQGVYKSGRRTHSYIKRNNLSGTDKPVDSFRRGRENPMRWRKREDRPRTWQKSPAGGPSPWKKPDGGSSPWRKPGGEARPYRKAGPRPKRYGFKARGSFRGRLRTNN